MRWRWLAAGMATALLFGAAVVVLRPYPRAALRARMSLVVTDRHGSPLRVLPMPGGGRALWVPLSEIAPAVVQATLAGEDHRFFQHHGVEPLALGRAVWLALRHGHAVSGASTLTMQLGRLVVPHPRTLLQKAGEMIDALRIERTLTKAEILEQYLNRAYYGNGAFGIEAAARRYFGKSAAALSPGEATLLAVLPRAPRGYDPLVYLPRALKRRTHVLGLMAKRGMLDAPAQARIEAEPVVIRDAAPTEDLAPHFVDRVLAGLPVDRLVHGGEVRTTLDLRLQTRLAAAVRTHLVFRQARGLAQAGAVIVDPKTGDVLAMVGSGSHAGKDGQINITTTRRHPGSTLKPFVYALAIEAGASPASIAVDERDHIPGYHPHKPMRERGPKRFREALAGSLNLAAVDTLARVGVPATLERLRMAGLGPLSGTTVDYGMDLALGSPRVRLVELAAAYGFLVRGGRVAQARVRLDELVASEQVFAEDASWLVMDILADAGARRAVFGAELPLDLPFPVAAKTGTSSGFADTLTVAATREAVVAAWAGAFDGSGTKGALAMWSAAPLARAGLLAVRDLAGAPLTLPPPPPGIETVDVCPLSGLRPGPTCAHKREHVPAGHGPALECPGHAPPRSPSATSRYKRGGDMASFVQSYGDDEAL